MLNPPGTLSILPLSQQCDQQCTQPSLTLSIPTPLCTCIAHLDLPAATPLHHTLVLLAGLPRTLAHSHSVRMMLVKMLAALAIAILHPSLPAAATWHGAHLSLSGPSRNLLAEKPTGIRLSQVSLAATPLSELLKDRGLDASMSTDPGFSKANPAELVAPKRPLKIAFYDRLDKSRTAEEHEYIMGRLMPAAANVLATSMRVRVPS